MKEPRTVTLDRIDFVKLSNCTRGDIRRLEELKKQRRGTRRADIQNRIDDLTRVTIELNQQLSDADLAAAKKEN